MHKRSYVTWISAIALLMVAAAAAALVGWLGTTPARGDSPAPPPRTAQPAALPRGTIEFVTDAPWQALRPRIGLDVLVLDLDALESEDAALTLVAHWRARHGAAQRLDCWVRSVASQAAGAAAPILARAGCSRVYVAS